MKAIIAFITVLLLLLTMAVAGRTDLFYHSVVVHDVDHRDPVIEGFVSVDNVFEETQVKFYSDTLDVYYSTPGLEGNRNILQADGSIKVETHGSNEHGIRFLWDEVGLTPGYHYIKVTASPEDGNKEAHWRYREIFVHR